MAKKQNNTNTSIKGGVITEGTRISDGASNAKPTVSKPKIKPQGQKKSSS